MTRVEFIVNLQNQLSETARLCENYLNKGHQLTINCGSKEKQAALSALLWNYSAASFLPHASNDERHAGFAPIHLYVDGADLQQDDILINLDQEVPLFFGRFRHLIEVVGEAEAEKQTARERWMFYRDRGYALRSTDVKKTI